MGAEIPFDPANIRRIAQSASQPEAKRGRVLEVYPGPDGMVRTVKVKTKDSIFIRPIQELCLLENDFEMVWRSNLNRLWASWPDCPKADVLFALEFNEQTWTCHFTLFLFCRTICTMLHKAIGIWLHDYSEFAFSHVLTDCSVSCSSRRSLFDILHRM